MTRILEKYINLIELYTNKKISTKIFCDEFLETFKSENEKISEDEFEILDKLFGEVDSFTEDKIFLNEDPNFYLDEGMMHESALLALSQLKDLRNPNSAVEV